MKVDDEDELNKISFSVEVNEEKEVEDTVTVTSSEQESNDISDIKTNQRDKIFAFTAEWKMAATEQDGAGSSFISSYLKDFSSCFSSFFLPGQKTTLHGKIMECGRDSMGKPWE